METIKRSRFNRRIILQNGKISCDCCCPDFFCKRTDIDLNIFEITREEYKNYYNGGTWRIEANIILDYTTFYPDSDPFYLYEKTTGNSYSIYEQYASGCQHNIDGLGSGPYTVTTEVATNEGSGFIYLENGGGSFLQINIKKINNKYYANYLSLIEFVRSTSFGCSPAVPNQNTNPLLGTYPVDRSVIVDGNNIATYGFLLPAVSGFRFEESTKIEMVATFTPSA
jgi:hypothetical protein